MVHFREVQRMKQWWLWLLVLGTAGLMWYGAFQQLILGIPFGDKPAPDLVLIIFWLLFGIGLPYFIGMHKLTTEVRDKHLYVRFSPYHNSKGVIIPFDEILSCESVTYNPISEYGGWGILLGLAVERIT